MKNKRLWLSVALTVLVVVCAMLILSRVNEARSNAVPTAPTDLILPPDIRTTAAPTQKTYDDLPDVDISSWEYLIASQAHNISDYVPDVSKISGSQSTFDSRAVDALNALLKAARSAGWSPYIYCAYRPYLTQKQQYEDQVSAYMREGDTRDEAETAAARVAAPPGTSDHQTGLGADVVVEAAGTAGEAGTAHAELTNRVVLLAIFLLAQHVIGFGDVLELLLGFLGLVDVRMVFAGELAVRLLDVVVRSVLGDTKDFVEVFAEPFVFSHSCLLSRKVFM